MRPGYAHFCFTNWNNLTLNFCDKYLKSSDKFLTNASRLGFINYMLSIKIIFILTAKALYFSNPFDFYIRVTNSLHFQMTIIAF